MPARIAQAMESRNKMPNANIVPKKRMAIGVKRNSPLHGMGGGGNSCNKSNWAFGKKAVHLNFLSQVCFIRYFGKSSGS
jgi:hypothetical protein